MYARFQRFLCFLVVGVLLVFPVCAAGPSEPPVDETVGLDVEASVPVVVQGATADDIASSLASAIAELTYQGEIDPDSVVAIPVPYVDDSGIAPAFVVDDGTTSEPSGTLKSILVKLIGPYNPVIVQYRYHTSSSGNYSYLREIQPDYVWCASAGLFALLVFCTFRLGGVLLRKT